MRRIVGLLVVVAFAVLLSVPVTQIAQGAPSASSGVLSGSVGTVQLDQPTATPNPTAPPGPNLNPEQQQPPNKTKQKLAIGVFAGILLAIVIFGRSARSKRKRKSEGATSK